MQDTRQIIAIGAAVIVLHNKVADGFYKGCLWYDAICADQKSFLDSFPLKWGTLTNG